MPTETPLTDEINALTAYANTVTGQSDTCLSDAVATLADGYGGGGGSITKVTGSVTGNGTSIMSFAVDKAPDIILVYSSDIDSDITAVSDRAHRLSLMYCHYIKATLYTTAGSTNLANSGCAKAGELGVTTSPALNTASYVDGILYIKSGNNSNLWSTSLTYNYVLYYLS